MACYAFDGIKPVVDTGSYLHPDSTIIGEVVIGKNVFIGAGAVLRGDFGRIVVGDGANVQENCVIHCFPNKSVTIASNAHIGHGAIIHGAEIQSNALIGMNAVIMDDAVIGANAIVGALSLVGAGKRIGANKLAYGNPAREVRDLRPEELAWKSDGTKLYQELTAARLTQPCKPITASEANAMRSSHWQYQTKKDFFNS